MKRAFLLCAACAAAFARADKIDDFIKSQMDKSHIPGLAFGIMRDGKLIRSGAYGKSDIEVDTRANVENIFEIGSCTKQFTAFAILLLRDEGKLNLDDPVSKWIPEAPPSWADIKLKNLLYQTSGLEDYAFVPGIGLTDSYERKDWFDKVTKLPLDFQPGVAWAYSNTNYALLGYVIAKAAVEPYEKFVNERILKPVGMDHTIFVDAYAVVPNRAHGYLYLENRLDRALPSGRGIDSDGTLASTVADFAKWDAALADRKLLSPEGYKIMWSRAELNSGRTRAYGTGWMLNQAWEPTYMGHPGNSSGYSAGFARFPEDHLSVVVLCNLYPVGAEVMAKAIAYLVDPKLKPAPPSPASDPNLARTGKIEDALAALAKGDPDETKLEPEVAAPLKSARAKAFPSGFAPLAKIEKIDYCNELKQGDDTWITYRVELKKNEYVLRVLWSKDGKLASAALSALG